MRHQQYLPRKLLPRSLLCLTTKHRGTVFVPEGNHMFFRSIILRQPQAKVGTPLNAGNALPQYFRIES